MSIFQNTRLETFHLHTVPPRPATAAEGDRFFSIKANYLWVSPRHRHAIHKSQARHVVPHSEFFSLGPAIVRRIFASAGVFLPDEVFDVITPRALARFSAALAGHPRAAATVLPMSLNIYDSLRPRPARPAFESRIVLRVPGGNLTVAASKLATAVSGDKCSVCLEGFDTAKDKSSVAMQIVRTPCSHVFHKYCLDQWLCRNRTCPVCRQALK